MPGGCSNPWVSNHTAEVARSTPRGGPASRVVTKVFFMLINHFGVVYSVFKDCRTVTLGGQSVIGDTTS